MKDNLKGRYCPDPSLWGVNLEEMLKWRKDALSALSYWQGLPIEIEKLIKSYPRKISKRAVVQVVEEIISLIPFGYTNCNPLELFCQRYSFYGEFGINHVFYLCIAPLLVADESWQRKYSIKVNGPNDDEKLYYLLWQTEKIVKARKEIEEATIKLGSYQTGKEVFANELREYLNKGETANTHKSDFSNYFPIILPYSGRGVGSREFVKKALDWNAITTYEHIDF